MDHMHAKDNVRLPVGSINRAETNERMERRTDQQMLPIAVHFPLKKLISGQGRSPVSTSSPLAMHLLAGGPLRDVHITHHISSHLTLFHRK